MSMTIEEYNAITKDLLANVSDVGTVSQYLMQLTDDYSATLAELANANQRAEELTIANESLRNANMELFLKIGKTDPTPKGEEDENEDEDEEKLNFDDLFNDKGELK